MNQANQTSANPAAKRDNQGLVNLLDRIAKAEGSINPNDRAVARLYAQRMRNTAIRQEDLEPAEQHQ